MNRRHAISTGVAAVAALFGGSALWRGTRPAAAATEGNFEIVLSEAEWRERLTPEQYAILRDHGTERAFSSPLDRETRPGMFHCAGCDQGRLFLREKVRFGNGVGRASGMASPVPSAFRRTAPSSWCGPNAIAAAAAAIWATSSTTGRAPTGKRHCINGVAMNFIPTDAPA